jgi:putative Holliday junction resolvase
MGLDPGKIVGVALSDVTLMLASPYGSLKRAKLSRQRGRDHRPSAPRKAPAGWWSACHWAWTAASAPRPRRPKTGPLALSEATGLPARMWDERLSSSAVNRMLIQEADLTRAKRAQVVDAAAAAYMLQAALDATAS